MPLNPTFLNALTQQAIHPKCVYDYAFRQHLLLAYARKNSNPWPGGEQILIPFNYGTSDAGAYSIGTPWNTAMEDPVSALKFQMKNYRATMNTQEELIDIQSGPMAIFDHLKIKHERAVRSLDTEHAVDIYRHGQNLGTGAGQNRILNFNGLEEGVNNGVDPSIFGNVIPNYGEQVRASVGQGLISFQKWLGDRATGATGRILYRDILTAITAATIGVEKPDLLVTSKAGKIACQTELEAKQTFMTGQDPVWGTESVKIDNVTLSVDEYCPTSDTQLALDPKVPKMGDTNNTYQITTPATVTSGGGLPASTTIYAGEPLFGLNTKYFDWWQSMNALFSYGLAGWQREFNNSNLTNVIRNRANWTTPRPQLHFVLFGFAPQS